MRSSKRSSARREPGEAPRALSRPAAPGRFVMMIARWMPRLLLLLSLAPATLAGAPLYHCRTTGLEGFTCGCCPDTPRTGAEGPAEGAPRGCCSRHRAAPQDAPTSTPPSSPRVSTPASPSICACCEVVPDRFASLAPAERSEREGLFRLVAMPACEFDPSSIAAALRDLAAGGIPDPLPPHRPPLPLLHAALRC